jgi:hypothetical protein
VRVMTTMAYSRHPVRLAGVLGGSLGLVLALAASPFASQASAAETHGAGDARPAVSDGTWGQAKEVPGTAALNAGGQAGIASVSCASAGNCSAGGSYEDASGHAQAFVAGEVDGMWGQAKEVPGTATLNSGGDAGVLSVSCASAGNCSAGGEYEGTSGHIQAFVAGEVNGVWGLAKEVPGSAALNTGEDAQVISVSCASAGNCSAGGFYLALVSPGVHHGFAFVVSEVNGVWGQAQEVPGLAALGSKLGAETMSVSCASAGNCTAGGSFESFDHTEAFVVGEVNGVWGQAQEVPGLAALNTLGDAEVRSVSCGSAGNCAAGGFYLGTSDHTQAFVASEVNGVWGQAKEVPGTAALNTGGFAQVLSASCASAGNCSAGGYYTDSSGHAQAFVAGEVNGVWGQAKEVPGTAALNAGDGAEIVSVSCSSAGNCSAGGGYDVPSNHAEAFVVSEANGVWGQAKEVPGTAALNAGGQAAINSVSCASPGYCSAGGSYLDASSHQQAFVVSDAN